MCSYHSCFAQEDFSGASVLLISPILVSSEKIMFIKKRRLVLEEKLSAWQRERRLWWAEGRSTVNILHIASRTFCILHLGQFIRPLVEAGNISTFPPLPLGLAYFWILNQFSFREYYFKYWWWWWRWRRTKKSCPFSVKEVAVQCQPLEASGHSSADTSSHLHQIFLRKCRKYFLVWEKA